MSPKPVQHQLGAQARKGSCHTAGRHQKGQVKQHAFSGNCHCHQHLAGVVEDGAQDAGQPNGAAADHVTEKQHAKQAEQASGQAVEEGHHAASKEGA